jgi:TPR repeat protein
VATYDVASIICQTLGRGVTRSKRRALQCLRKAAENGHANACSRLAIRMYGDDPYAREVGHVVEAAGVVTSAGVTEGHDVPQDVMTNVLHWLRMGGMNPFEWLPVLRTHALEGGQYCRNDGCEVVGQPKDFKVCPQCKTARYCGDECEKQDWNAGGHKKTCGTAASIERMAT